MPKARHPDQPIVIVDEVARFKRNPIVCDLLDAARVHGLDLNTIAVRAQNGSYAVEDLVQLDQLLGYSVSGIGDLSYVPKASVRRWDAEVEKLVTKRRRKK